MTPDCNGGTVVAIYRRPRLHRLPELRQLLDSPPEHFVDALHLCAASIALLKPLVLVRADVARLFGRPFERLYEGAGQS